MRPPPLFVFGTLLDARVRGLVLGRSKTATRPATLHRHRLRRVVGQLYPMAVPHAKGRVSGRLLSNLTEKDLMRLDAYEGTEYIRAPMAVFTPAGRRVMAQIYLATAGTRNDGHGWSLRGWRRAGGMLRVRAALSWAAAHTRVGQCPTPRFCHART